MNDLKEREESKRASRLDARARWLLLQEAMDWAERQSTARRNTARRCLEEEARKNGRLNVSGRG